MEDNENNYEEERPENTEEMIFHYKKGSFRKNEPKIYRDLATGVTEPPKGFFKVLFATRGNKIIFFTMIACMVIVYFVGMFSGKDSGSVAGYGAELSAFSFEGRIYTSLTFKQGKNHLPAKNAVFEVSFSAVNQEGSVADSADSAVSLPESLKNPAHAIFSDYDITKVQCIIRYENSEIFLETPVMKK